MQSVGQFIVANSAGGLLAALPDGSVACNRSAADEWARWTVFRAFDRRVLLRNCASGQWLGVDHVGGLCCTARVCGVAETFQLCRGSDMKIALRCIQGRYVSAKPGASPACNSACAGPDEMFSPVPSAHIPCPLPAAAIGDSPCKTDSDSDSAAARKRSRPSRDALSDESLPTTARRASPSKPSQ